MNVSREEKRAEAVKRMKALGIYAETIRQFEQQGRVSTSEPPLGAFYWVDEEQAARIREFEEKNDALVYMVVRSYLQDDDKLDHYLFVSKYREEWDYELKDLMVNHRVPCYTYNYNAPWCSEGGFIVVQTTIAGGLKQIY